MCIQLNKTNIAYHHLTWSFINWLLIISISSCMCHKKKSHLIRLNSMIFHLKKFRFTIRKKYQCKIAKSDYQFHTHIFMANLCKRCCACGVAHLQVVSIFFVSCTPFLMEYIKRTQSFILTNNFGIIGSLFLLLSQ